MSVQSREWAQVEFNQQQSSDVDARALAEDLRARIEGEVRFDNGSRALYATDASNYRQTPIGVVIPRSIEDVVQTVALCRQHGAPLLSRGGGTSLAGQCCNVAVVVDFSKYLNRVLEIDPRRQRARVQPGTILDTLRDRAEQHDLTFGPDPATHNHCTLGGMIGNNSCGIHSVMAGRTSDNVEELEVLTHDGLRMRVGRASEDELAQIIGQGGRRGEIYAGLRSIRDRYADLIRERYPDIPRRVSGYNLDELLPEKGFNVARALVGTEGTCATVLEATVRLVPSPPARSLLVLGYPDVYSAGDHIPQVMEHGPVGCEGIDDNLVRYMDMKGLHASDIQLLPEGRGWLLVELGGQNKAEADDRARELMEALEKEGHPPSTKLFHDYEQEHKVWGIRESGLGATAYVPGMPDTWPGWEDSAVPPEQLGAYLRDLRALFKRFGYQCALYGHFGQACVHVRIDFDLVSSEGIAKYRRFVDEASDLVLRYGGSFSGEHGDGQSRAELLPKMYGQELVEAFREFKSLWDPDWKMNPGKVVDPYPITSNLRLGSDYNPWRPETQFKFAEDHFSFPHATLRCVGVGKCRREGGGVMCPSYMVTREEMHSTRGRAHLLFEMLRGETIRDGWHSEAVKEALDLCLACKGCKGECPVNVDMATYKAEFLSHYFRGRLRPRSAYAFGLIMYWAQIASRVPGLANVFTQMPLLRDVAKLAAGMPSERQIPPFARETFQSWYDRRGPRNQGKPSVILWPDTFNNHFYPQTARAAVDVLEAAGFQVVVPDGFMCCGRPLYDYGMLEQAKAFLQGTVDRFRSQVRDGVYIVGLEPSCVSVFRDELVELFPHDHDAKRLSQQTLLLSEFLADKVDGYQPPMLQGDAIVQGHCHQQAVLGMDAERRLMAAAGLNAEILDSGCCGMAGSFGFEKGDRYEVSVQCGERVLLPAVRRADRDTLILADGFSCREQIRQGTRRQAVHLAEALQSALRHQDRTSLPDYPERELTADGQGNTGPIFKTVRTTSLIGAGMAAAGAAVVWTVKRRKR